MKNTILVMAASMFMMGGCVSSSTGNIECSPEIVMAPLPKKCGKYDMEYGTINPKGFLVRFKDKEAVHLLGDFTMEGIVGRDVVVAGKYWPQYIGGLLREDGSSSGSYIVHNLQEAKLVQVYGDKGLDKCRLYRWCNGLK